MKPAKKISLSSRIFGTIILCWFVPIILTIGVVGFYMYNTHFQGKLQELVLQLDFDKQLCTERLNSLVTASKKVSYDGDIEKYYQKYKKGEMDAAGLTSFSQKYVSDVYSHNLEIREAILWFCEEPKDMRCYVYNLNAGGSYNAVNRYWEKDHDLICGYAKTLDTAVGFYENDGRIYMVRNLMNRYYDSMGVLVIRINPDYCFGNLLAKGMDNSINIKLQDCLFVLHGGRLEEEKLQIVGNVGQTTGYELDRPQLLLFSSTKQDAYTMQIYMLYEDSSSLIPLYGYRAIVGMMFILVVPLLYFCIRVIRKYISEPIKAMTCGAVEIEEGNLGYQVKQEPKSREFGYLMDTFNHMSERLKRQFNHIYEEEVALRDARIMALQSHINPHFMNNTLEIINWEARMNGCEKVSKMIGALSVLLDASLDRKKVPEVTLEEEMRYVNAYLYIISERFGDRIHVINNLEEDLMSCHVPRLILQPVIENAIEHGVAKKSSGTVQLEGKAEGGFLYIDIINDAANGLDKEKIGRLLDLKYDASQESSGSLGIANVNQRLHILYGEPCGLQIYELEDDKICAHVTILLDKDHKEIQ